MKRPKIRADKEMRDLLLKARRVAQRALEDGKWEELDDFTAANMAIARSIIAVTKPSWVRSASYEEALQVLRYIARDTSA